MLEANAAMRSMVHRVSQKTWRQYLRMLAKEAGIEHPTDDDLRRIDRKRKGKKVSNADWASPTDPDSRIARMKDGTTHFAYKAEHAVDVESDLVVAAEIHQADDPDTDTVLVTATAAREQLEAVQSEHTGEELLGDKGYHKAETLDLLEGVLGMRPYIPEPKLAHQRVWTDKPPEHRAAVYRNRRRVRGARGRRLSRLRSEYAERSFAHLCETGATRRLWLRGQENVAKWYVMRVAARNLSVIMRALFNIGTPRGLQGLGARLLALVGRLYALLLSLRPRLHRFHPHALHAAAPAPTAAYRGSRRQSRLLQRAPRPPLPTTDTRCPCRSSIRMATRWFTGLSSASRMCSERSARRHVSPAAAGAPRPTTAARTALTRRTRTVKWNALPRPRSPASGAGATAVLRHPGRQYRRRRRVLVGPHR